MNTKKKKCCGLDVPLETIIAAISANGKTVEVKELSTLTCQLRRLCDGFKRME